MKIARTLLPVAVAVLSLGISAYAQDAQSWAVNVPFAFTAGHTSMEAGRYTIQQHGPLTVLVSKDGKSAALATIPNYRQQPSTQSSLIFKHAGDEYALAEITNMGSNIELDARASKRTPREMEASTASQTVQVAAIGTR